MDLNKNTILQIIGILMKKPSLLAEVDRYSLSPKDFHTTFERYIFAAINNLYQNGAEVVTVVDIDNYLNTHEVAYQVFKENNGIEYLNDAEDLSQVENFEYYYKRLKKFNLIRDLKLTGFNTNKIYPESLLEEDVEQKLENFERMSVQDIFDNIKSKLIKIEDEYSSGAAKETKKANIGVGELLEELSISPEVGVNLQGTIFNTIVRGGRKGKFYLRSAGSGTGKTRNMVGDACFMAYPIIYNTHTERWEYHGSTEKVLYIATEQELDEIQTMILAYLSGINEEKILFNNLSDNERIILEQAVKVMDKFSDNLIIVQLPNPSMEQIKTTIRKHCLLDGVENVFYDYIFSSPALLSELKELKIREDVMLNLLSTMLKDLAVELQVFIMSATQLNGEADKQTGIKNQNSLRGAKSIADKIDMGAIMSRVGFEELRTLDALIKKTGMQPNIVTDIYKLRRGRYTNVRIWSSIDLGTLRKTDLFLTDGNYQVVNGFTPVQIMFEEKNLKDINEFLDFLNNGVVTKEIETEVLFTNEDKILPLDNGGLFGNFL